MDVVQLEGLPLYMAVLHRWTRMGRYTSRAGMFGGIIKFDFTRQECPQMGPKWPEFEDIDSINILYRRD